MAAGSNGKATMGRQKIEIKKIVSEEALQVCFSKRRAGLFKKASELSTLCGAEIAIVVFSPAGRPYSLGLPDMETITNRFLVRNPAPPADEVARGVHHSPFLLPNRHRGLMSRDLNRRLMELRAVLDQQRGMRAAVEGAAKESARRFGIGDCGPDFEGLMLEDLEKLERAMCQLRERLAERMDELGRNPAADPMMGSGLGVGIGPMGVGEFGGPGTVLGYRGGNMFQMYPAAGGARLDPVQVPNPNHLTDYVGGGDGGVVVPSGYGFPPANGYFNRMQ